MKKIIPILLLLLCLSGCAKCISTEYETVEVTIVEEYHRGMYVTPMIVNKMTTMITHPAVYQIIVAYDGNEYTIDGSETYEKFKDKVGETVLGELEIKTYSNGTVEHTIVSLF